jgi:Skp family chaperone for outer membrane proteins
MIEQLSGDVNLVGTRSRGALRRPFTVVQKMQVEAQDEFRGTITKLNAEREAAQAKLRELQGKKEPGQRLIASPEQMAEIKAQEKREREIGREIRDINKRLRERTESLENKVKWSNIAGVPVLVAAAGIFLAIIRKQRTKAQ